MGPDQGAEGGGTPPPQALNLGVPCLLTKQETCLLTLALLLMDSEGYQSLTARPQCSHLWNRSWGQGPRGTALGRPSRVGFFCSTWALASAGPSSHLAVPAVPRGGGHLLGLSISLAQANRLGTDWRGRRRGSPVGQRRKHCLTHLPEVQVLALDFGLPRSGTQRPKPRGVLEAALLVGESRVLRRAAETQ